MCSILSKELNFMMNPVASVIWDMISVPLKSAGNFFCIQLAFHCTLVGWEIQSIICSLRYTVRGEKILHATNQPTTRPAATDKKKVQPEWQQAEYQHLWTDNRWATSRQSDCQGCPRSSSQQPRPPGAEQQRCGCTNTLMHFSAGSHTSAGVQIKGLRDCSGQTNVEDEWTGPASSSSPGSTLKAHLKSIFRVSVQSHPFTPFWSVSG